MKVAVRVAAWLLAICILLLSCGCEQQQVSIFIPAGPMESHLEKVSQMEQTGDSTYIPGIRTGTPRTGMTFANHMFECTDDGAYFLALSPIQYELDGKIQEGNAPFLFFAPHDSDQIIKLCGRPDCTHNTRSCNACFDSSLNNITYYDGYLYIPCKQSMSEKNMFALYRVDLDGSNRLKVGGFGDWSEYSGWTLTVVIDGVFTYILTKVDHETGKNITHRYYYALDGSMEEPIKAEHGYSHINQELMDVRIGQDGEKMGYMIYSTDFRSDEWTFVFNAMDYGQGYWGKEYGYVLIDNAVTRVHYEDGREETLFETGLEGEYHPRFFPDCIVLTQTADGEGNLPEVPMVYFYSWEGNFLGELSIDFEYDAPSVTAIMGAGETKDRIYLYTTISSNGLPQYYIEKSDFGTGHIELRTCQYPDLSEENYQELFSIKAW